MKSDMSSSTKLLAKKITLRALYSIFTFNLLILIFSPSISHYVLSDYLKSELNLSLSEETSIRLNLFTNHLTIRDLSIIEELENTNKQTVFALKSLDAEIRLHRLIVKQLYISEFSINGFYLLAEKQTDLLRISGIDFPVSESEQNNRTKNQAVEQVQEQAEEAGNFEVILPRFLFSESEILAKIDGIAHKFIIELLSVKALLFSNQQQKLNLTLKSTLDVAPFNLNAKVALKEFRGVITSDLQLSGFKLKNMIQFLPESIKELSGEFSFNHTNKINLSDAGIAIDSASSEIKLNGVVFQDNLIKASQKSLNFVLTNMLTNIDRNGDISTQVKSIDLKIDAVELEKDQFLVDISEIASKFENLKVNMPKDEELSVELNGVFNLNKFSSYVNSRTNLIAQLDSFDAGKITLNLAEKLNVQIEELGVTRAIYSKIIDENDKSNDGILGFSRFAINNVLFNDELLSIDGVKLSGLYGNIDIEENGEMKNSVSLSSKHEKQYSGNNKALDIADKTSVEEDRKNALKFIVKSVEVVDSKTITFTDQSVAPEYKRDIFIDRLSITELDSSKPQTKSLFILKARSDKYTKIDFSGFIKPFTSKLNLKVEGALTEVSLPPASSYIRDALTFEFESGELDTQIDLEINDAIISGSTLIKIRGMALASSDNYDQGVLQEQTSLPLNVALGMLKDSDDNVELDIPMYGDIDSPVFGISSFIALITKKAVQSAATDYMMQTFVPYASVVSLTISAADFLMKLRFEDLPYEHGQTNISESQMVYMNQFVALMKDKKEAQVKVCAISTASELAGLGYSSISMDDESLKSEQVDQLKELSNLRMNQFKEYVVEQSIESKRILLCSPKVDLTPEAKPIIAISI